MIDSGANVDLDWGAPVTSGLDKALLLSIEDRYWSDALEQVDDQSRHHNEVTPNPLHQQALVSELVLEVSKVHDDVSDVSLVKTEPIEIPLGASSSSSTTCSSPALTSSSEASCISTMSSSTQSSINCPKMCWWCHSALVERDNWYVGCDLLFCSDRCREERLNLSEDDPLLTDLPELDTAHEGCPPCKRVARGTLCTNVNVCD